MRKLHAFGLAMSYLAATGTGAWMTACSSSNAGTSSVPDGGDAAGGQVGGDSSTEGGDGSTTGAGGGGGACQSCSCLPSADLACTLQQGAGACPNCCITSHQSGATIFVNSVIQNCCAPCRTACAATLCSPNASAPDQLCANCIAGQLAPGSGTGCRATVTAACDDNSDCVAYSNCSACCP